MNEEKECSVCLGKGRIPVGYKWRGVFILTGYRECPICGKEQKNDSNPS
nr:MAG: hypothetical protein [Lokiarchaeota virus Skoll Meg22_1214]